MEEEGICKYVVGQGSEERGVEEEGICRVWWKRVVRKGVWWWRVVYEEGVWWKRVVRKGGGGGGRG